MMQPRFDPQAVETKRYAQQQASGAFAANPTSANTPWCLMMPPPNVTGSLHIGHALTFTLQDILVRFHRALGKDVLYMPGTDHAGIATQMVVERQLAANKEPTRHSLGRTAFLEKVWAWKKQSGDTIVRQQHALGLSADWPRSRFTMDEGLSVAVRHAFVRLHRDGLIYRAKRLINWDPALKTSVSDLEAPTKEVKGEMFFYRYPLVAGSPTTDAANHAVDEAHSAADNFNPDAPHIVVGTTRPETMFGNVAVAVHPDDERYKHLIGQCVRLPLSGRLMPIIADPYADPSFGTGAVHLTPAHDFNDFTLAQQHNLPLITIMDENAALNDTPNIPLRFRGLDRYKARQAIVKELDERGYLADRKPHVHSVPHGDRSGVVLEPRLMDQWFVDAGKLAPRCIAAAENGEITFVPAQWKNNYLSWLRAIQPWCISRQLWWGHQIPAWYASDGTIFVAESEDEALEAAERHFGTRVALQQDEDVLDTWFSSGLWPFSTLGWPQQTPELARYYPTDTLVTGFDIIFFWVIRMVMLGTYFMDKVPFKTVVMHGLVRDEQGQKMSKTKGNVIDPLSIMDEYGTDALRFTMAALAGQGRDIRLSRQRIEGYRNFVTKLWNAARFCTMNQCSVPEQFNSATLQQPYNQWVVHSLAQATATARAALQAHNFSDATQALYSFAWNTYCDWYLELIKPILLDTNHPNRAETQATAAYTLLTLMRALHPIMPFVTEEIASALSGGTVDSLVSGRWPTLSTPTTPAVDDINKLIDVISAIRAARAEVNVPANANITVLVQDSGTMYDWLVGHQTVIGRLAKVADLQPLTGQPPKGCLQIPFLSATLFVPVADIIDLAAEAKRLHKEITRLQAEVENLQRKLNNPDFISRAEAEVVDEHRERLADAEDLLTRLSGAVARLSA